MTTLYLACKMGDLDVAKTFVLRPDYDLHSAWDSPIHVACSNEHIHIVEWLIDSGVEPDCALYWGAYYGNFEIVNLAINKGATNFNVGLSQAASSGNLELVKYFIDIGANDFDSALFEACSNNDLQIAQLLIQNGASNIIIQEILKHNADPHDWLIALSANMLDFLTQIKFKRNFEQFVHS